MMAKYNVGDKVRILDVDAIDFGDRHYYNGMETEVVELFLGEFPKLRNKFGMRGISILGNEYHAIERITEYTPTKPKKSERITALETQVAELQAKVEALESAGKYPLTERFERESTSMDAILADIERKAKPTLEALLATYPAVKPTPNQQRADVIERAKEYADTRYDRWYRNKLCNVEFVVNPDKRTVVALLRGKYDTNLRAKGIAKCDPDDVFNVDIGKAIALARALGVEVPTEFVKAVQPTEVVVGMVVGSNTESFDDFTVDTVSSKNGNIELYDCDGTWAHDFSVRITDDTDAVYE